MQAPGTRVRPSYSGVLTEVFGRGQSRATGGNTRILPGNNAVGERSEETPDNSDSDGTRRSICSINAHLSPDLHTLQTDRRNHGYVYWGGGVHIEAYMPAYRPTYVVGLFANS